MFDFYFQSGEFESGGSGFWEFFIQVVASLIGAGSAVWIYWSQQNNAIEDAYEEKRNFERDKLRYLYNLIRRSINATQSLVEGIDDFKIKLENDPANIGYIVMESDKDLGRAVSEINQEEYYHPYRNQVGDNAIVTIFYCMDTIFGIKDYLLPDLDEVKKVRDYNRKQEFVSLVNELSTMLLRELRMMEYNNEINVPLYGLYSNWYLTYKSIPAEHRGNMTQIYNLFVVKVYNELSKNLYKKPNVDIQIVSMNAFVKYNELKALNLNTINGIESNVKQIRKALKNLKRSSKLLKSNVENNFTNNEVVHFKAFDLRYLRIPYRLILVKK